jgi:drug/metabolite transporter (DMT)-like permease
MIFILFSVLASLGLFIAFRMFQTYAIHTRQAIMLNYLTAGLIGFLLFDHEPGFHLAPWFGPSLLLGVLFYTVFRVMAKVTQMHGLSVAGIATKMSVVIPVMLGLFFLGEAKGLLKIIAIAAGLVAVILSAGASIQRNELKWPLILFIGSGVIDAALKLFQHHWVSASAFPSFSASVFLAAFASALVHHVASSDRVVNVATAVGGIALGLLNFFALYFLLQALSIPSLESSVIFPINNFGIIAGSTLIGVFLLHEHMTPKGWLGFALASLSITLLYFVK